MDPVAKVSPLVDEMAKDWTVVETLLGGTRAMREAGTLFLPQRSLEVNSDYQNRLNQATLYPAFAETLSSMTGRVFADPITIGDDVPSWIRSEVLDDIDKQGRNLHVFSREWFFQGLGLGLSHVLVETPPRGNVRTRADEVAQKIRPYVIHIHPNRVIGWKVVNGELRQVRIKFEREEDDGEFGTVVIPQIRVYEPRRVRTYEENKEKSWAVVSDVPTEFDGIPLVTFYTGRNGTLTATPPLRELAYLNVKHWSMQSSVDSLLDIASVPILVATGMGDDSEIVIGAKSAIKMEVGGDLKFVEHTGAAIGAGRTALDSLKEEMRDAGARLLRIGSGTKTATQAGEDNARENSQLGAIVQNFEDALDALLDVIAGMRADTDGGSITVNANLDPDFAPTETVNLLMTLNDRGKLSDATLFAEVQRRKLVSSEVTWEDEQARILEQATAAPEPEPPPQSEPEEEEEEEEIEE
jgi:hypothetical protein